MIEQKLCVRSSWSTLKISYKWPWLVPYRHGLRKFNPLGQSRKVPFLVVQKRPKLGWDIDCMIYYRLFCKVTNIWCIDLKRSLFLVSKTISLRNFRKVTMCENWIFKNSDFLYLICLLQTRRVFRFHVSISSIKWKYSPVMRLHKRLMFKYIRWGV